MQVNTQFDKGWRNAILFCIELIVKQAANINIYGIAC